MTKENGHGGARIGAGRPKGSRMRRSEALAERLIAQDQCPVEALVRLAQAAEEDGERGEAIAAWKSVLPYIYPKPKAVEVDASGVLEFAQELAVVRAEAQQESQGEHYHALLAQMEAVIGSD